MSMRAGDSKMVPVRWNGGAVANWRLVPLMKEKDSLSSSPLLSDSNTSRALCEISQFF